MFGVGAGAKKPSGPNETNMWPGSALSWLDLGFGLVSAT